MGLTWLAASSQPAVGPTLELASAAWTAEPAGARQEQRDEQSPIQTSHLISLAAPAGARSKRDEQPTSDRPTSHIFGCVGGPAGAQFQGRLGHNFAPTMVCVCVCVRGAGQAKRGEGPLTDWPAMGGGDGGVLPAAISVLLSSSCRECRYATALITTASRRRWGHNRRGAEVISSPKVATVPGGGWGRQWGVGEGQWRVLRRRRAHSHPPSSTTCHGTPALPAPPPPPPPPAAGLSLTGLQPPTVPLAGEAAAAVAAA